MWPALSAVWEVTPWRFGLAAEVWAKYLPGFSTWRTFHTIRFASWIACART
jgi:hypothetical protein